MKFILSKLSLFLLGLITSCSVNAIDVIVVDTKNNPIGGVAVYIDNAKPLEKTASTKNSVMPTVSQKDKKFQPYITIVQAGNLVNFDNQDDITHHIYSAIGKNKFSFKVHANDKGKQIKFDHTGKVPMGCNIHDWMSGHVLVVATPVYGLTNGKGLVSLPAEQGVVRIWHPQMSTADNNQEINVNGSQKTIKIMLKQPMKDIPQQESLDDFDFLDDY